MRIDYDRAFSILGCDQCARQYNDDKSVWVVLDGISAGIRQSAARLNPLAAAGHVGTQVRYGPHPEYVSQLVTFSVQHDAGGPAYVSRRRPCVPRVHSAHVLAQCRRAVRD
jgi:hypothetical protein